MNTVALLSIGAMVLIIITVLTIGFTIEAIKEKQLIRASHIFYLAVLLYILSLCLPVWETETSKSIMGFEALLIGWLGILTLDPRWACNLVVIFSALCVFGNSKKSFRLYNFLLAITGSTAVFGPYHGGMSMGTFDLFEGTGLASGGYAWIASLWLFAIASYVKNENTVTQTADEI